MPVPGVGGFEAVKEIKDTKNSARKGQEQGSESEPIHEILRISEGETVSKVLPYPVRDSRLIRDKQIIPLESSSLPGPLGLMGLSPWNVFQRLSGWIASSGTRCGSIDIESA